jgi:hypothetical protein
MRFLMMFFAGAFACDPVCTDPLTDWSLSPRQSG